MAYPFLKNMGARLKSSSDDDDPTATSHLLYIFNPGLPVLFNVKLSRIQLWQLALESRLPCPKRYNVNGVLISRKVHTAFILFLGSWLFKLLALIVFN